MQKPSCPDCRAVFDSWAKLRHHHTKEHGEPLPNKECEICGSEFEYYPSEKKGLYCPECVESENWRHNPDITGSDNPRWTGGKLKLECAVCNETIERYPSNVTGEATLCDRNCFEDWLSDAFTGDGHPNWEGGGTDTYGKGWNRVRRRALERDGHECVVCGTTSEALGRNPDVHHIVPVRLFDRSDDCTKADAHDLYNVVSLCPACHRSAEFGKLSKEQLWDAIDAPADGRFCILTAIGP